MSKESEPKHEIPDAIDQGIENYNYMSRRDFLNSFARAVACFGIGALGISREDTAQDHQRAARLKIEENFATSNDKMTEKEKGLEIARANRLRSQERLFNGILTFGGFGLSAESLLKMLRLKNGMRTMKEIELAVKRSESEGDNR